MNEFAQKRANSANITLALGAKLCKAHICNIFPQGKFYANLFFRPVQGLGNFLLLRQVRNVLAVLCPLCQNLMSYNVRINVNVN